MRSMTAYASATRETEAGRLTIEIHSVNRKMLDIHVSLPREMLRFDIEVRKWIGAKVLRGQLTIRISKTQEKGVVVPSLPEMKKLHSSWETLAKELGFDPKTQVTLSFLANQYATSSSEASPSDEKILKELVEAGLTEFLAMKEREGAILLADISKRLTIFIEALGTIEKRAAASVPGHIEKLKMRIQEAGIAIDTNDERLVKELVLFADKVDMTEEVVRLRAHLKQIDHVIQTGEKSVGRTLDFLIQEMHRETNTIAAKTVDSEISALTVTMRSEIERIREQVQNIE